MVGKTRSRLEFQSTTIGTQQFLYSSGNPLYNHLIPLEIAGCMFHCPLGQHNPLLIESRVQAMDRAALNLELFRSIEKSWQNL